MHLREHYVLHQGDHTRGEDDIWAFARAVRLDAPHGAWVGTARGVAASDLSVTQMLYEPTDGDAYVG
jgi:hypothetical protein